MELELPGRKLLRVLAIKALGFLTRNRHRVYVDVAPGAFSTRLLYLSRGALSCAMDRRLLERHLGRLPRHTKRRILSRRCIPLENGHFGRIDFASFLDYSLVRMILDRRHDDGTPPVYRDEPLHYT